MLLQLSSSHAQTAAPEMAPDPTEILAFEQMRVPRWLAETVVWADQVTGVDPAYLMALADKEFEPAAGQQGPHLLGRGAVPARRGHLAGGAAPLRTQARLCGGSRGHPDRPGRPVVSDKDERGRYRWLRFRGGSAR